MDIFFILFLSLIMTEAEFSFIMRYYCKKNKGICNNCSCWSCPRKRYLFKE